MTPRADRHPRRRSGGSIFGDRYPVPRIPDELAGQLAVLVNGAFVSSQIFAPGEATTLLRRAADALIAAGRG
jgi:hypothetical protein